MYEKKKQQVYKNNKDEQHKYRRKEKNKCTEKNNVKKNNNSPKQFAINGTNKQMQDSDIATQYNDGNNTYNSDQGQIHREEVATDMRHVDESHFLTTTHEAYKPIDPSEYRQKRTVGEEVTTDMRHVDESHFLTTTHEAYKPIDPAAYKRDALREEVVKVSRRGGDDGHFRTTAKDSYCRYDSSCYKSSCRESSFGDESVISKRHSFTASSEADAAVVKKVVKGKSDGGVTSKKVDVSTDMKCVASGESNGGAAAVVAATTECAAAAVGDQPTGNGVRVSKWKKAPNVGYSCPCHVDADMYVSTAHRDFKAHGASKPYMPKAAPTVKQSSISMQGVSSEYRNRFIRPEVQCPPRPIGKPAVQVRHVDPSMYVTTNRATFVNHSGRKV